MIFSKEDFNLVHTFECGQCFRWNKSDENIYMGVVGDSVIKAVENDDNIEICCDDDSILQNYFDTSRDYSAIKTALADKDEILKKAIPSGYGIRILNQDPWEALVSFIISANNNIPRIKKIINSLCINFGNKIDEGFYTFPSSGVLAKLPVEELDVIKSGFRAKYILDAAQKVSSGLVKLDDVYNMSTTCGREYLMQIKGVGNKVADCILLFAYQKFDVFPKDVWIKKVLNDLYGVNEKDFDSFVETKFGDLAGFAQQYLFYYMRG